jgi:hypothetical protein
VDIVEEANTAESSTRKLPIEKIPRTLAGRAALKRCRARPPPIEKPPTKMLSYSTLNCSSCSLIYVFIYIVYRKIRASNHVKFMVDG